MEQIILQQPQKIVFGWGCMSQFTKDYLELGYRHLFILTAPAIIPMIQSTVNELEKNGVNVCIYSNIIGEPTVSDFNKVLSEARAFHADSVAGIGGGSVLDLSKLVATLINSEQDVTSLFGTGFVKSRGVWFACIPTTSGTGSEVSPNAILLDETDYLKKGIVSPFIIANATYNDPQLTVSVPAKITAETGMDALTHCIEAYTNKFAHPAVDLYALQGIRLIASHLVRAVNDGHDREAREAMSLGSLYGGLCLGPVNTAAVHALSYPLGGEFHISHGLSNSILLPSVMKFNAPSNVKKYAEVAVACGVSSGDNDTETAQKGVAWIEQLSKDCRIPAKLTEIGIPRTAVNHMAEAAMKVTRLLKNNPREVTKDDAKAIYESLY
jgi:alcohol dehydrogenase class IV